MILSKVFEKNLKDQKIIFLNKVLDFIVFNTYILEILLKELDYL